MLDRGECFGDHIGAIFGNMDDIFKLFLIFPIYFIVGEALATRILLDESYGFRTFTSLTKLNLFAKQMFGNYQNQGTKTHSPCSLRFITFPASIFVLVFASTLY